MARASASPVTVPKQVNAIDMAKSPEFTSRPNKPESRGERFRDLFRQITGTKAQSQGLDALRVTTDVSALACGRNSGSATHRYLEFTRTELLRRSRRQRDAELPPNRTAPSWRGPRCGFIRRLSQQFVNPKPPPCARTWHAGRTLARRLECLRVTG